jgi:gliding motility-associated-like protein
VVDKIPPVITGCSDITVNANGFCQAVVNWRTPSVSDNCTGGSITRTTSKPSGSTFAKGTTVVSYKATDLAGNIATCSFNVNVVDNLPPVITGCSDITATANASCQAVVNWSAPSFTENCSNGSITLVTSKPPGSTFDKGTTVVTYKATDAAGNIATCSFNVNVVDNAPPIITGCPTDITMNANASCQAVVSWTIPSLANNCAATLTSNKKPGSTFDKGTTLVTYTATNAAGETATCSFNVTVIEAAPQLTDCPTSITVTAGPSCQAIVNWIAPTVMDNCVDVTLTSNKTPGTIFEKGTTVVTYTATDVNGKTANCSFEVSVIDAAPLFTSCPSDITKDATDAGMAFVDWAVPTAEASCDNFQMTATHRPGDIFPIGQTLVEYTATSDNGVFSTCSFMVTITLPQIIANEVLTPDGDNKNDVWLIENIEKFPDNHVIVFDRWGSVVFRVNAYNNSSIAWNGLNLPTGTYYYTLSVNVLGSKIEKKGFIELIK